MGKYCILIINKRSFCIAQIRKLLFFFIGKLLIGGRTLSNIKSILIGGETFIIMHSYSLFLNKIVLYFNLLLILIPILNCYFLTVKQIC